MKRIILMSIFTSIFAFGKSYVDIRNEFKLRLYHRQEGLMKQEKYLAFIEPYLQKAEKTLEIARYCMNNSDSRLSEDYFDCLLNFNVACFHDYIKSNTLTQNTVEKYSKQLLSCLVQIKNKAMLNSLDVEKEFAVTSMLFDQANRAYYKALGIHKKFLLLFV